MTALKQEIAQQRPFASPHEEALLNLMRTADCISRAFQQTTRQWKITSTQYNVLRILRGALPSGLPCSVIGERMITAEPDITRLLARLKVLKLIRQQRDRQDRRVVLTFITEAGQQLLRQMDPTIERLPPELLGHLSKDQLTDFIGLLELARKGCGNRTHEPPTCTGADESLSCDGTARKSA